MKPRSLFLSNSQHSHLCSAAGPGSYSSAAKVIFRGFKLFLREALKNHVFRRVSVEQYSKGQYLVLLVSPLSKVRSSSVNKTEAQIISLNQSQSLI